MDKPIWKLAKRFSDERSGLCVDVNTSPGRYGSVLYSVSTGRLIQNGPPETSVYAKPEEARFVPHIRVFKDTSSMVVVRVQNPFAGTLANLLASAEEWITTELALAHDEDLDVRRERELAKANFGKPVVRKTGKTERRRQARSKVSP